MQNVTHIIAVHKGKKEVKMFSIHRHLAMSVMWVMNTQELSNHSDDGRAKARTVGLRIFCGG